MGRGTNQTIAGCEMVAQAWIKVEQRSPNTWQAATIRFGASATSTLHLILLGLAALYGGTSWLIILIPAALLVYTAPVLRSGRD